MNLKAQQPPLTIEEQIRNLESIGLLIPDEDVAKKFLNNVSYFRLVKAYSLDLKSKNGNYYKNVSFDNIVNLYSFDVRFRQLIFPLIEGIEIGLRCQLANYFSSKYGVLGYEEPGNFNNTYYHSIFIDDVRVEIDRNKKAPFVKNFSENYSGRKIPLYALVELFSFGTLSKFFKNMKNLDKKAVATSFGIGYTYFESWIESIAYVRNICAHYGRLYNARLSKKPALYAQYSGYGVENDRVFSIMVCIKHIIPNDGAWHEFVETVNLLLEQYPVVEMSKIGFIPEWKDILLS